MSGGLDDNFTQDTALNTGLWQINGPVGSTFGIDDGGGVDTLVPLAPSFSPAGMEIAQVNASYEVGTIQSRESFAPLLTVNASAEGTVSNGHPFVLGLTTANATSGIAVTANLDPRDCSNEANCADPTTCGTPADPSIPANQCYYGICAKLGTSDATWPKHTPLLGTTPSVGIVYALQISVDGSGNADFSMSHGGHVLGSSTARVGGGPFYIVMAQSEGAPVPGPGPNQAFGFSVSEIPSVSGSLLPPAGSSPSGLSYLRLLLLVVAAVISILVLLARNSRRRGITVTVLDSGTLSAVPGAGVSVDGPKYLSGRTGHDGRVVFGGVKVGDYSVKADAVGYTSSVPVTVSVTKAGRHTVRLDPVAPSAARVVEEPHRRPAPLKGGPTPPGRPTSPVPGAPPVPLPTAPGPPEPEEREGWGGERVRQIIRTFQRKGAVSPETALTAEELGLSRWFVRIMKRRRGKTVLFIEVNGRYYLEQKALQEMQELRSR